MTAWMGFGPSQCLLFSHDKIEAHGKTSMPQVRVELAVFECSETMQAVKLWVKNILCLD
jgi:hypothetical protein